MCTMQKLRFSLISVFLSLLIPWGGYASAAALYLSPDTVRIHSGGSEEFPLELRADNGISGMSLYSVYIAIDKSTLVVDSVKEGPIFYTCGATVQFYSRYNTDSTMLIVQSLIIWPRCSVNGPGLLATIYMRNIASGIFNCSIDTIEVRDVNNAIITGVTGKGSILYLNAPPSPFNLTAPANGAPLLFVPGDSVSASWEASITHYVGDSVLYELAVSSDPSFPSAQTHYYGNIKLTHYKIPQSVLAEGNNYWKVRAYDTYGFSRYATQTNWYFVMSYNQPPSTFALLTPHNDSLLNVIGKSLEYFDWAPATTIIPNDTLRYALYAGRGSTFPGNEDFVLGNLLLDETTVSVDSFKLYTQYYWAVKCTNRVGQSSWSTSVFKAKFYIRGDANGDKKVNVGDAVYLINYIFKSGSAPAYAQMGDANCDNRINVGDVVFLINYIFKGGAAPCQ